MLYDISLRIDYSYAAPVMHARNLLRLLPNDIAGEQTVLSRQLTVDPLPSERRDFPDFFDNTTSCVAWHQPIQSFSLSLALRAERQPPPGQFDLSPPLRALPSEIAAARDLSPAAPHHFTAASRRGPVLPEFTDFARARLRPGMTVLEAVQAIGGALHAEMQFAAGATDVDTPAQDAFAARHGVCQDFSHIMIGCLRGVGIPAGYVSGFLRTYPPPGRPRLAGADAMHAWVRAWAGAEMGWIEYDPTNDQPAGADYVTIGHGRDYDDVAPVRGIVRGIVRGAGGRSTAQSVDVAVVP
ncbi:transglutaminase family protein [Rhodobacteraceae bacterium 2CG4]|uniref:Transglutaminase family protein n=1 Tax=Halovulum marinum TaxID=2662447 RepID=A0A6L5Z667_9RHOB|nr:transglutaminase family protein [Halovulum marinum]MSU91472.1 transglutaminase family protein [Halovulum marinum]